MPRLLWPLTAAEMNRRIEERKARAAASRRKSARRRRELAKLFPHLK